jgi:hypothetical protein
MKAVEAEDVMSIRMSSLQRNGIQMGDYLARREPQHQQEYHYGFFAVQSDVRNSKFS